jgi:hypothetical protein
VILFGTQQCRKIINLQSEKSIPSFILMASPSISVSALNAAPKATLIFRGIDVLSDFANLVARIWQILFRNSASRSPYLKGHLTKPTSTVAWAIAQCAGRKASTASDWVLGAP